MELTNNDERLVAAAHNAIFLKAIKNSPAAFSLPIVTENELNWSYLYVMNNKPTEAEGI